MRPVFLANQQSIYVVDEFYAHLVVVSNNPLLIAHNSRLLVHEIDGNENETQEVNILLAIYTIFPILTFLQFFQCSICMNDLIDGRQVVATRCGHLFHSECIVEWFRHNQICPLCRNRASIRRLRNVYPTLMPLYDRVHVRLVMEVNGHDTLINRGRLQVLDFNVFRDVTVLSNQIFFKTVAGFGKS